MEKVMKYELRYLDGGGEFYEMQRALWELQKQIREILNKTMQDRFRAMTINEKWNEKAMYHRMCEEYPDMITSTVNATLRTAKKKFSSSSKEILRGTMSLPSYKRDQPILLHPDSIKLEWNEKKFIVTLGVFSTKYKETHPGVDRPRFELVVGDGTQRTILERLTDGLYKLSRSQLKYYKGKWFLFLSCSFEPQKRLVDESKVLGVDLGSTVAIFASSYGTKGVFKIPGDEITAFERKQAAMQKREPKGALQRLEELEDRRWEKQKQARYCGDGRIGHGTKTRVAPAYQDKDKIARFQETLNHRYSRALVDYAVKNGYGTIQMEDLSGIQEDNDFPKRLRHWTYYNLQSKIAAKAGAEGINVVKIKPDYTSQRCSQCGYISPENRKTQADFVCMKCGFKANADYNASQNISIPSIDKVIEEVNGEKKTVAKKTRAKKKRAE